MAKAFVAAFGHYKIFFVGRLKLQQFHFRTPIPGKGTCGNCLILSVNLYGIVRSGAAKAISLS